MSDPLTDPRAQQLLKTELEEIGALIVIFTGISNHAQTLSTQLPAQAGAVNWSGSAASAMKSSIGKLTPGLTQVTGAYQHVSSQLSAYHDVVAEVQPKFKSLVHTLQATQAQISSLGTSYAQQSATATAATTAQNKAADSGVSTKALNTLGKTASTDSAEASATASSLATAQDHLTTLQAQGMALLQQFSDARDSANAKVAGVAHQAPKESTWDKLVHDAGDVVSPLVSMFKGIAADTLALPGDVSNVIEHHNLASVEKLAKDAGVTLAAAGAVAGLVATGGGAAGLEEGVVETLSDTAAVATKGSMAAGFLEGGTKIGEGHVEDGIIDMGFSSLPEGSNLAGVGDEAVEQSEQLASGAGKYGAAIDEGASPADAFASLSEKEQAAMNNLDAVPITGHGAADLQDGAETQLPIDTRNLNLRGRPSDVVVEQAGTDPIKDKLDGSDPEPKPTPLPADISRQLAAAGVK